MESRDYQILHEFANAVRRKLTDAAIWGFGSRARGTATEESDFDVCVVVENLPPQNRRIIQDAAWEVGFKHNTVITTIKYARHNFEEGPCSMSPLVRQVLKEGVAA